MQKRRVEAQTDEFMIGARRPEPEEALRRASLEFGGKAGQMSKQFAARVQPLSFPHSLHEERQFDLDRTAGCHPWKCKPTRIETRWPLCPKALSTRMDGSRYPRLHQK
jgi:hypothetical protein